MGDPITTGSICILRILLLIPGFAVRQVAAVATSGVAPPGGQQAPLPLQGQQLPPFMARLAESNAKEFNSTTKHVQVLIP